MSTKEKVQTTEPMRPFCLRYADARSEVFNSINAAMRIHGVPMFLMENILTEALNQIKVGANHEMQTASESYQAQMEEFKKAKNKGGTQNG